MLERRPAIAVDNHSGRDGANGTRALTLSLVQGWHLTLFAALGGAAPALRDTLAAVLGTIPSTSPAIAQTLGTGHLFLTAPGQYWLVTRDASLMQRAVAALDPSQATATPLTHSRVRVAIRGARAAELLARGITVDLHPGAFATGAFVQTGLHHSGVLLHRLEAQRYDLYLPRTYAVSLWEWLTDAALPFGYDTATETDAAPA